MSSKFAQRRAAYKRTGVGAKTHSRAVASRAAASILRQAGYSNARAAYMNSRMGIPAALRARGQEVKVLDINQSSAQLPNAVLALNSTGTVLFLNALEVGSTFCNRVGRRVTWKSIRVMAQLGTRGAVVTAALDVARLIVVYDRQPNGALPAMSTIIQQTDQATTNTTTALAGINMNNRDRFEVIMDTRIALPVTAASASADAPSSITPSELPTVHSANGCHQTLIVDEFRNLKNHVSHYQADSVPSVIGDISTGAFYLVALGGIAAGSEAWQISKYSIRMKFHD